MVVSASFVSAGSVTAVDAGEAVLRRGGNAVDAAVAATFGSMVAEPVLTAPGGGGFLLVAPQGEPPILLDFFVNVPRTRPRLENTELSEPEVADIPSGRADGDSSFEFFPVGVDFGTAVQRFHIGRGSAAVPGSVAGLCHAVERWGRMDLSEVVAPAVGAAHQGVPVSSHLAYLFRILTPILLNEDSVRRVFAPEGSVPEEGDRLKLKDLGAFLQRLGDEGPGFFYRGDVARCLAAWAGRSGLIREEDLSDYCVIERSPLVSRFNGFDVYLNPPPAQGGWLVEVSLVLMEALRKAKGRVDAVDLARVFDSTNRLRRVLAPGGLPGPGRIPASRTAPFLTEQERLLESAKGWPSSGPAPRNLGSTTHCSVIDSEGNAAAITTTNGEGCGSVPDGLGFMLNNMLGEEDLNPGGFHRHRGGERLPSMMCPTLVRKEGETVLVTGSSGSNRIRSAIIQVLRNILLEGLSVEEATDAPRIHLEGETLSAEAGWDVDALTDAGLPFSIELWTEPNLFFGGVNSVSPTQGAGDRRRGAVWRRVE